MKVLVVVDMQNDFVNGTLGSSDAVEIIPRVVRRINDFTGPIMVTQDTHTSDYLSTIEGKHLPIEHCIKFSHGWQLHPEILDALSKKIQEGYEVGSFSKSTFGSVYLAETLRNHMQSMKDETLEEIILIGVCTDFCVISNAMLLKAFFPETTISVDAYCCAASSREWQDRALSLMEHCHINVLNHIHI